MIDGKSFLIGPKKAKSHQRQTYVFLVDEDTKSFNAIINAFRLPKGNDDEKAKRKEAVQAATKYAIEVPFEVMNYTRCNPFEVIKAMAEIGNPNSISDAAVGALCAQSSDSRSFFKRKN